jgi:hypothetical protein
VDADEYETIVGSKTRLINGKLSVCSGPPTYRSFRLACDRPAEGHSWDRFHTSASQVSAMSPSMPFALPQMTIGTITVGTRPAAPPMPTASFRKDRPDELLSITDHFGEISTGQLSSWGTNALRSPDRAAGRYPCSRHRTPGASG